MGIFKKLRDASRWVDEISDLEAPRPKPAPKPAPKPKPTKADMGMPTPAGGGGCPLRLLEMCGFGGVVVATLAAAVVGRARR
jgi:hypothetical protein